MFCFFFFFFFFYDSGSDYDCVCGYDSGSGYDGAGGYDSGSASGYDGGCGSDIGSGYDGAGGCFFSLFHILTEVYFHPAITIDNKITIKTQRTSDIECINVVHCLICSLRILFLKI